MQMERAIIESKLIAFAALEEDSQIRCDNCLTPISNQGWDAVVRISSAPLTHRGVEFAKDPGSVALGNLIGMLGWKDCRAERSNRAISVRIARSQLQGAVAAHREADRRADAAQAKVSLEPFRQLGTDERLPCRAVGIIDIETPARR